MKIDIVIIYDYLFEHQLRMRDIINILTTDKMSIFADFNDVFKYYFA